MSNKKPPNKRTHAGLCLDLLDDEHKLLMREVALLLQRVGRLSVDCEVEYLGIGGMRKRCPICHARSHNLLDNFDCETFDALPIVHDAACSGQHAVRLLESNQALRFLGDLEWVSPLTTSGKALRQQIDEQLATLNAEVAP